MLKIISSYIRDFAIVLADKALLRMCDQALQLLDPQKQKVRSIKDVVTYAEGKPDISRVLNFLKTGLNTITNRIKGLKQGTGESAPKAVKLLEDYKILFKEAVDKIEDIGQTEEKSSALNIAAKNVVLVKEGLENEQNKKLLQDAQMNK